MASHSGLPVTRALLAWHTVNMKHSWLTDSMSANLSRVVVGVSKSLMPVRILMNWFWDLCSSAISPLVVVVWLHSFEMY